MEGQTNRRQRLVSALRWTARVWSCPAEAGLYEKPPAARFPPIPARPLPTLV
jgi:hypothetical protein